MQELINMSNSVLINECIRLDREQKASKAEQDRYKRELQARGTLVMEDKNIRYTKFYSDAGSAAFTESMKLDVMNPDKLKEWLSEGVYKQKVKENVKTEYKYDTKLERALKAIFLGDYTFEMSLSEFLDEMAVKPNEKQKKLLLKKLSGNYDKDKDTITSVLNLDKEVDIDVELWFIYRIKNAELIQAFFPYEGIDAVIAALRKFILVETKTAITIDYSDDNKEEQENG